VRQLDSEGPADAGHYPDHISRILWIRLADCAQSLIYYIPAFFHNCCKSTWRQPNHAGPIWYVRKVSGVPFEQATLYKTKVVVIKSVN